MDQPTVITAWIKHWFLLQSNDLCGDDSGAASIRSKNKHCIFIITVHILWILLPTCQKCTRSHYNEWFGWYHADNEYDYYLMSM